MKRYYPMIAVAGGILLLIGALLQLTRLWVAPYLYIIGAVAFAYVQVLAGYDGTDVVLRRLRRQQVLGAVLLVLAGVLMFTHHHNEWVLCLSIAAVFEVYTAFRLG